MRIEAVLKYSIIASIALVFFACGSNESSKKSVFRYNESGSLTSLDPAFTANFENIWLVNQLYDGLLEFDDELGLKNCLADSFTIAEDGLSYLFYLKDNVYFHKDSAQKAAKLKASDVAFSLQRLIDPNVASPGRWVMNDVERSGDSLYIDYNNKKRTVYIRLAQANASFIYKLAMPYCKVISKDAYLKNPKTFYANPVGSGPFKFFIWENRVEVVLHKNENYHQSDENGYKLPYLDAIAVTFLKDPNAIFLSALNKQFNLVSGLTGEFRGELLDRKGQLKTSYKNDFVLRKVPFLQTEYLGVYLDKSKPINPNLLNPEVRKALSMAIDRDKLVNQLRGGIGVSDVKGFVPKVLLPQRKATDYFQYNLPAAQKILSKEIPNGDFGTLTLSAAAAQSDLCEFVQNAWTKLGFTVVADIEPNSALSNNIAIGNKPLFRKGWIADYPDPENFLSLFYSDNFSPNGPNYTHFISAEYDALFDKLLATTNDSVKLELNIKLDSIVSANMPVIPLYYGEVTHLLSKNVVNFSSNSMNILNLKAVKLSADI